MSDSRRDSTSNSHAQKDAEIQKLKEELKEERAKFNLVLEALMKSKAENEALEKENALIKEEIDVLKARLEQLDNAGGLSRILITSDEYHGRKENKNLAKLIWGLGAWWETKEFLDVMFEIKPNVDTQKGAVDMKKPLSYFEQALMTLFHMEQDISRELVGEIFGVHRNTASKYIDIWTRHFGDVGDCMSSILPFIDEKVHVI